MAMALSVPLPPVAVAGPQPSSEPTAATSTTTTTTTTTTVTETRTAAFLTAWVPLAQVPQAQHLVHNHQGGHGHGHGGHGGHGADATVAAAHDASANAATGAMPPPSHVLCAWPAVLCTSPECASLGIPVSFMGIPPHPSVANVVGSGPAPGAAPPPPLPPQQPQQPEQQAPRPSTMAWTRDADLRLAEAVAALGPEDADVRSRGRRDWNAIAAAVNTSLRTNATPADCQRRWSRLVRAVMRAAPPRS